MSKGNLLSRDSFGSKIGVIAATAGSAIGLGNIWRFPYIAGENGGAAFLIVYLLFIVGIGIPVMISEFVIGRRSQRNTVGAFRHLAPKTKAWQAVGFIGVVAAFIILAFYTTVAGWTLEYLVVAIKNGFANKTEAMLSEDFGAFCVSGLRPAIWQIIFMFLTGFVVFKGIKDGIEKYTKILMPMLLIIIIILCIKSIMLPGAEQGLKFLFHFDFSKIDGNVLIEALGQSFFSLSIGMGTLITYGSYISKKENLTSTAISVAFTDTLIAVLAGVAIFPAVFAFGIEPNQGPGLVFITLPMIFNQMAGGYIFALIFFLLLSIAALTSTISLLEVAVAYFSEELNISRKKATILCSCAAAVLGVGCTMSMGDWSWLNINGTNLFDLFDKLSANVLLPFGGLMVVIFVGWNIKKKQVFDEISNEGKRKAHLKWIYLFIVKFIAPIAISFIFLNAIGLFD